MITNYFYLIHTADCKILGADYKIFFIRQHHISNALVFIQSISIFQKIVNNNIPTFEMIL